MDNLPTAVVQSRFNPGKYVNPSACQVYQPSCKILLEPAKADLGQAEAETWLWSLDGGRASIADHRPTQEKNRQNYLLRNPIKGRDNVG
jgi:hypothetical protein